jgi:hypothetical protein
MSRHDTARNVADAARLPKSPCVRPSAHRNGTRRFARRLNSSTPLMKRRLRFWLCLLGGGATLGAQPISDAPVLNFRLPIFNELGYRIWDLRAAAVRNLDNDRIELTTVHLRMLAGDDAGTVEGDLYTPSAVVDQAARTVSGEGQLQVIGRGVELYGNDWSYDGKTKSIVIKHNVVVAFTGDLGNIIQ